MKKTLLTLFVITFITVFSIAPSQAITIGFDQINRTTVNVVATLAQGEIVSAYDLDVGFNPAIVNILDVTFGTYLGDSLTGFISYPNYVDFFQMSVETDTTLLGLQTSGQIVLASLLFDAVGFGTSPLFFTNPGGPNNIVGANGVEYSWTAVTMQPGSINVPEPSILLLISFGLVSIGAGVYRRTRQ
jgi:hypothetical protein